MSKPKSKRKPISAGNMSRAKRVAHDHDKKMLAELNRSVLETVHEINNSGSMMGQFIQIVAIAKNVLPELTSDSRFESLKGLVEGFAQKIVELREIGIALCRKQNPGEDLLQFSVEKHQLIFQLQGILEQVRNDMLANQEFAQEIANQLDAAQEQKMEAARQAAMQKMQESTPEGEAEPDMEFSQETDAVSPVTVTPEQLDTVNSFGPDETFIPKNCGCDPKCEDCTCDHGCDEAPDEEPSVVEDDDQERAESPEPVTAV